MKIVNNHKYSKKPFNDYKFRYRVRFEIIGEEHPTYIDIYSTNENSDEVVDVVNNLSNKNNVSKICLYHKASKEDDRRTSELLKDFNP